jgi:xanthine dehydrogenase YagT iron-sulfur-binding subunit
MTDGINRREFMQGGAAAAGAAVSTSLEAAGERRGDPSFSNSLTTRLELNGRAMSVSHEARVSLLDLLREHLQVTGTKKGCNEGACGACTVLLDGKRVNACMTLAACCEGRAITTVEGLAGADGTLHAVQQAFIDQDAFQCGYCTPGQIVSAVACVREGHTRSRAEIAEWMSGNLCRCAGYPQIVAAVEQAAGVPARA